MDKKQFNSELEAFVAENSDATKQDITAHMVVQGASAAMCMRELTNKRLAELGVDIEMRATDPAVVPGLVRGGDGRSLRDQVLPLA